MKKTLLALAMVTAMTASGQRKWTLSDCINYAIENNLSLRHARLTQQAAQENTKQSKAELMPSLSASTNHNVGWEPFIDSETSVGGGKIRKTYYSGSYGINGKWTIWNGGKNTTQLRSDRLAEEQALLDVMEQENSIQEQIAQLYVQILYTNEAIAVNKQSLETSKKNEERGQQMVEVGSMSKAELAELSAQRATDEYNVVESETNLAKYKVQLKQLLELTDNEFDIAMSTASDEQALAAIPSLASVYEQALLTRPEVKNAELEVKQADLQLKIAKAGYMPTVSLSAGVGTNTSTRNANGWGEQMKTGLSATAGVGVTVPIFDNRLTKTAVNKAKIQREQALLEQQNERDNLYDTIEDYWLDANSNQQKFRAAVANVESEQQSYNLLSEQFELGLKNIVELMTGKATLLRAQQNMLQAKYQTILCQQLLNFYQGKNMDI